MGTTNDRVRLFVALDLPGDVRSALVEWRSTALGGIDGLRLLAPESLHVTLCFLGWRGVEEVDEIAAACEQAIGPALSGLSFGEALWLPERGRPRVAAVSVSDPAGGVLRLQSSVADALSAGGWYAREARPFVAHVTVARVGRGGRVPRVELSAPPRSGFDPPSISLYRSQLGAGGARYEALRVFLLGSAAARDRAGVFDPVDVVRRFHGLQAEVYAGGPIEALRPLLASDVVWHVPGRSAIAGEHRGVDAVLSYFELRRRLTDETFRVTVHGLAEIGDRVVQLAGGTAVRDGRSMTWETVGVFRVREGLIAECWLVPFDLFAFDEVWA